MPPVKRDESYPVTAAEEEKRPHGLLAGTACPELLLSEYFVMSKEQKKAEKERGRVSPQTLGRWDMNSGPPPAEKIFCF